MFPCLKCPDRRSGCHGSCEKYRNAKTKHEEDAKLKRKKKDEENIVQGYIDASVKANKKRRKGGAK